MVTFNINGAANGQVVVKLLEEDKIVMALTYVGQRDPVLDSLAVDALQHMYDSIPSQGSADDE